MWSSAGSPLWLNNRESAPRAAFVAGQRRSRESAELCRLKKGYRVIKKGGWEARKAQWTQASTGRTVSCEKQNPGARSVKKPMMNKVGPPL